MLVLVLMLFAVTLMLYTTPAMADPAGPIQWRSTTQLTSGGAWTRLLKLQNGDWLSVYTVFPQALLPSQLRIARSTDDARTWTVSSTVADPNRKIDNGFLFQLPNGNILLTGRSLIDGQSYRLPVWRSTDGGVTWGSPISTIDANETPGGATNRGLWEPYLFLLPNGRLSVLYADETVAGYSQVISQRVSSDGGATWSPKTFAASQPGTARPGMPGVARMSDGRYILVFESCPEDPNCQVREKFSTDGTTWDGTLGTPVPMHGCGPFVASLADGRLLVTSCTNEVSYSNDLGATWQLVNPRPWGYGFAHTWPAIYQTGPNEFATVASNAGQKARFGTLSTFFDNFDDGNDSDWARYGGVFQLSGGTYSLNNAAGAGNTSGKALAGDANWTNGVVEADLTLTSPAGNAGVMARVTNPGPGQDAASGYYAYLDPALGVVGLGRQANSWTRLAAASMPVATNRRYRLALSTIGNTVRVYVDGVLKITVTDATFTRGQVGVRSHYANASYDNVVYTQTTARDNFNDGNDVGWTHYGGNPAPAGGVYALNNSGTSGKSAWTVGGTNSDFTFETDVRIASGTGDAGAIFRAQNLGAGADAMNGYYAGLNDSTDRLVLGRMNGSWQGIAIAPLTINANTWYHLKVSASGPNIRVFVGDMTTPKLDVTDPMWTSGYVGVRAHFTNAAFDNAALDCVPGAKTCTQIAP